MKTIKDMYYVAIGNVLDLFEKADTYKAFVEWAETKDEAKRYARRALKYKTKAIVEFDREMDTLTKG